MKLNQLIKTTVVTSAAFLLLSTNVFANQDLQPVKMEKPDSNTTIYKTTATADADRFNISQILNLNFIEDKNYNKDTLIVKASGNIYSGYLRPNPNDYNYSVLPWGGKYNVTLNALKGDSTTVVDYAPKNQTDSFQVQNTLSYGGGGDINISNNPTGSLNGKYSFSESISYKQEDYRTYINSGTNYKQVSWGVEANKIMNNGWGPYGRDAEDNGGTYGNELFLAKRNSSANAGQNFIPDYQIPLLARSNFNPEFLSVFTHKKNDHKKTQLKVTYQRETDFYEIIWNGFFWRGHNRKNYDPKTFNTIYEIDWQNHTAKVVKSWTEGY
ncbi:beta-channel forming cytolysin [Staphylococcus schleiferi subsp. coagulans]|uniref:beta-channel forming cytolysin n=1 Tax=Staphylococcus coagulans TaxID=74706 RepID=UPI0015FB8AB4|nr:beta-channel forming cytolysin [Staphylococcus coagulans]MBA8779896.1 beta-channel forming cytolysin [Staphylococcus coagulans]